MKQKVKKLNQEEQEALFALYCKHNGNKTKMAEEAGKNRNIIAHYEKEFDFKSRMLRSIAEEAKKVTDVSRDMLLHGKARCVEEAMRLLEVKKQKTLSQMTGKTYTKYIYPNSKDVKIAWEIIKTELGEPTSINQNNNKNEDVEKIDETRNALNNLMKDVQARTAKDTRK